MKKHLFIFAVLLLTIVAAGCSNSSNTSSNELDEVAKDEQLPIINELAIDHAYDIINDYEMVKDPYIEVSEEDKKITLAIQVNAATNEEHAKELGDNFARALGSGAAIYSDDELDSPDKENLGEIYEYYDLHIGIGSGPDNFIAQGAKVTSSPNITW